MIDVSLSEVFDISSVSTSISQSMTTETVDIADVSGTETKISLRNLTDNFAVLATLNAFDGAQAPFPSFNSGGVSGRLHKERHFQAWQQNMEVLW